MPPIDPHKITYLNAQVIGHGDGAGGDKDESGIGQIFYVSNDTTNLQEGADVGADISSYGQSPMAPFSTIDYAIGQCKASRGDKIIVLPGHAETLTAAIALDVAGVTIEGRGGGTLRPQITVNGVIDGINISAANCKLQNLYFNESTADAAANINVAAANVTIQDCWFDLGATDEDCITWASGAFLTSKGCRFEVTANGPDRAISIEAANDGGVFVDNVFNGLSDAAAWDNAAIYSASAFTKAFVDRNVFMYGIAYDLASSVSTVYGDYNIFGLGTSSAAAPHVWYSDLGSTIRDGSSPNAPTTLDDALVTKATAGDIVYVLAWSTSSPTASQAMSVAGVSLIGLGNAANRPVITPAGTIDHIDMTGANCRIENIAFAAATATATAVINVGAADCIIRNCEFLAGASNTNAVITIPDAGDHCLIEGNEFRVTANGPAIAISIESASCDRGVIRGNLFNGGSTTNQWDTAAINSSVAHTNYIIEKNTFLYGVSHAVGSSVSTLISQNVYGVNATPSALTPIVLYADSGSTVRTGLSPATPTSITDAISKVRDGAGDTVLLLPGTYTLSAALALGTSSDSMRLGPYIDNGTFNAIITTASDVDLVNLTGNSIEIFGLRFLGNAAQVANPTALIDIDTGNRCRIHHCEFDAANVDAIDCIDIAGTATRVQIDHCYFDNTDASDTAITDLGANTIVEYCSFECPEDVAAITTTSTAADGGIYRYNLFNGDGGSNAAMCAFESTAVIDFACYSNIFTGTSSATPFGQAANYATQFVNNYGPGATVVGGTLIDPVA